MNKNTKVAGVVVTYNRKELLAVCLDAICKQVYKPHTVYVVDNCSTDGTDFWIEQNQYNTFKNDIQFIHLRLPENIGGSGGFYSGMKAAYESSENFDAFWVMDDDGIPDSQQLQELIPYVGKIGYVSPLVIAKGNTNSCTFADCSVEELCTEAKDGLIHNIANPFNGVIYSRKVLDTIGYPERDMFIWGDELNYDGRCRKAGFTPSIVISAKHIHPKDRQVKIKVITSQKICVPIDDWKLYCYVRNYMFNAACLTSRKHCFKVICETILNYTYYCIKHKMCGKLKIIYRAIYDGVSKNLKRLNDYRN